MSALQSHPLQEVSPGQHLDHYLLETLIAKSLTCSVFKATDLTTGHPVAIKMLNISPESDTVFYQRFLREADIGQMLDHPGIPKVAREDSQTRAYHAMTWVEGRCLRHVLNSEGKIPVDEAVRIAVDICRVLAHVHEHGILHRDLKPENVMIGESGCISLIDFGIAAKVDAPRLTFGELSQVMGTAAYIAPEQIKGARGDARSDLFAVGVILYEMLTGEIPFRGENQLAIMNSRLVNRPISPRELTPQVPPELEQVLYRSLARNPKRRYTNVSELADHLERARSIQATDQRRFNRPRSRIERLIVLSGLAMIPVFIFVILLYVANHQ